MLKHMHFDYLFDKFLFLLIMEGKNMNTDRNLKIKVLRTLLFESHNIFMCICFAAR